MGNKLQNQPNKNGNDIIGKDLTKSSKRGKNYDVFISYRRLSRKDPQHRHATSLARSIAQQFKLEGYRAFFDCWTDAEEYECALKKSKYYIILFTPYSFDGKEEGEGDNFKVELDYIKEGVCNYENNKESVINTNGNQKTHLIRKENVLLINIDGLSTTKSIKEFFSNSKKEFLGSPIIELKTNSSFSIKELINKPEYDGGKRIKKFPRFSYNLCKKLSWATILIPLLGIILYQYLSTPIVFAGGGTVQKYIADHYGKNVNWYQRLLGWKYIHLPSEEAWSILWDDMTADGKNRQYWPVVLSSEVLTDDRIPKERLGTNVLVEYEVGTAPLMIQINDGHSIDSISLQDVFDKICDISYTIHTTSERSGTYNAYKKLLYDKFNKFNLDSCIMSRGRHDFTTKNYDKGYNKNIFLANKYWYCEALGETREVLGKTIPIYDITTTIPLYVYTIAEKADTGNTGFYETGPHVKKFLNKIECDTKQPINRTPKTTWKKKTISKQGCEKLKQRFKLSHH